MQNFKAKLTLSYLWKWNGKEMVFNLLLKNGIWGLKHSTSLLKYEVYTLLCVDKQTYATLADLNNEVS